MFMTSSTLPVLDLSWLLLLTAAYSKPKEGKTKANPRTTTIGMDDFSQSGSRTKSSKLVPESNGQSLARLSTRSEAEEDVHSVSQSAPFMTSSTTLKSIVALESEAMNEPWEDCSTELPEMKRVFQRFDEDHDNRICAADLRQFMGRLGIVISEEKALALLQTVDQNGNGNLKFAQFCALNDDGSAPWSKVQGLTDEEEDDILRVAFGVFDKNGDGFITAQELQAVLLELGMPEGKSLKNCERMIQGVDADGNGEIDITEFKNMMSSKFVHQ